MELLNVFKYSFEGLISTVGPMIIFAPVMSSIFSPFQIVLTLLVCWIFNIGRFYRSNYKYTEYVKTVQKRADLSFENGRINLIPVDGYDIDTAGKSKIKLASTNRKILNFSLFGHIILAALFTTKGLFFAAKAFSFIDAALIIYTIPPLIFLVFPRNGTVMAGLITFLFSYSSWHISDATMYFLTKNKFEFLYSSSIFDYFLCVLFSIAIYSNPIKRPNKIPTFNGYLILRTFFYAISSLAGYFVIFFYSYNPIDFDHINLSLFNISKNFDIVFLWFSALGFLTSALLFIKSLLIYYNPFFYYSKNIKIFNIANQGLKVGDYSNILPILFILAPLVGIASAIEYYYKKIDYFLIGFFSTFLIFSEIIIPVFIKAYSHIKYQSFRIGLERKEFRRKIQLIIFFFALIIMMIVSLIRFHLYNIQILDCYESIVGFSYKNIFDTDWGSLLYG